MTNIIWIMFFEQSEIKLGINNKIYIFKKTPDIWKLNNIISK